MAFFCIFVFSVIYVSRLRATDVTDSRSYYEVCFRSKHVKIKVKSTVVILPFIAARTKFKE